MNARMYDPVVARVLSPDNYVQDATGTQGYNRYVYVLNNPLKYTDPTGYFVPGGTEDNWAGWSSFSFDLEIIGYTNTVYSFGNSSNGLGSSMNTELNSSMSFLLPQQFVYEGLNPPAFMPTMQASTLAVPNMPAQILSPSNVSLAQGGGSTFYKEGSYSYSDWHIQYLPAEGIGALGGWSKTRGSAQVYQGKGGNYYARVSASGYTPASMRGTTVFSGDVQVYSGGQLISTHPLSVNRSGPSIIQSGLQSAGSATIPLPSYGSDVYLRFNVGYSYSEGAGWVTPIPAQGHHNLYIPHFTIDGWTY